MLDFSIRLDPAIFCNLKLIWLKSNSRFQNFIPAAVHPASLQIYAGDLDLSFEDAVASCASLNDVNIFFLITRDPSFVKLLRWHFAKNGGHIRCVRARPYPVSLLVTSMPPSPDGADDSIRHMEILEGAQPNCSCTICWECMRL